MLSDRYIKTLVTCCLAWPFLLNAQGIRIPAGSYVIANHGNIVTKFNWTNNGKFTHNGGYLVFAGDTQRINGSKSDTFYNVTVAAGSNTSIVTGGQTLRNILKSDGTLNANNNITLLANTARTALVDGSGTGQVLGNLTMQGYLSYGFGYKYLGSPFQAATVSELSGEVNLGAAFPSVYRHDENQASNGWITYTTLTDTLKPMRGYAIQMGTGTAAKTIDLNGVVSNGNISVALSNTNQAYTKGFNLVSNPYPSPINWDTTGWTKTNIDNTVYYFDADTSAADQYGGVYNSYINGVSSDGKANNIIPAMQGFFVHVTDGTFPVAGTLGISNGTRITTITKTYRQLNGTNDIPLLRLWVGFSGYPLSDPTVIYFPDNASKKFDKTRDALKFMNTSNRVPNLYSIDASGEKLSINAIPLPDSSTRVALGILGTQSGSLTFFTTDVSALPGNLYCYLHDEVTGTYSDLKTNKSYQCQVEAGTNQQRFSLVFSRKPILQNSPGADPATTNDRFQVNGTGRNIRLKLVMTTGEKALIRIINTAGQILYTKTYSQSGNYPLNLLLPQGMYQVVCYMDNNIITRQIFAGE